MDAQRSPAGSGTRRMQCRPSVNGTGAGLKRQLGLEPEATEGMATAGSRGRGQGSIAPAMTTAGEEVGCGGRWMVDGAASEGATTDTDLV